MTTSSKSATTGEKAAEKIESYLINDSLILGDLPDTKRIAQIIDSEISAAGGVAGQEKWHIEVDRNATSLGWLVNERGEKCSHTSAVFDLRRIRDAHNAGVQPQADKKEEQHRIEFPSVFDTPEKQAKYEAARREIHKHLQPLLDELDASTKLTAEDYAIVINAR